MSDPFQGCAILIKRFSVLDSWRGIAALMVALYHFGMNSHAFDWAVVRNASLFVDFFFVLSGFVLSHAYSTALHGGLSFWNYALRRFGRLWPLHAFVLAVLVGFEFYNIWLTNEGLMSPRPMFDAALGRDLPLFVQNLFLVQALGFEHRIGWNGPAWSISAELWVCLAFGLLCKALPKDRLAIAAAAIVLLMITLLWTMSPTYMGTSIVFAIPKAAAGFFLGHLVYRGRDLRATALPWATMWEAASVLLMVAFLSIVRVEASDPRTMLAPFIFAIVVWVFSFEGGRISKALAAPPFLAIGALSYSIYMIHDTISMQLGALVRGCIVDKGIRGCGAFAHIDQAFQESRWFADGVSVGYLVLVVALSAATYALIEKPGRSLFNRWATGKSRAAVTVMPEAEITGPADDASNAARR